MSRRATRRRGSGGHPARAAARRERGGGGATTEASLAREVAAAAARIESALEAEQWASDLLGIFARMRYELPLAEGVRIEPAMLYGEPVVRALARRSDAGAGVALAAIAELDPGELGVIAKESIDSAEARRRLPGWAAEIGELRIVGAAVMQEDVFDDAREVFLEARHADGSGCAVGVLIDHNLGGLAKDVVIAGSIDEVEAVIRTSSDDAAKLSIEPLAPGVASGLISAALALTDRTWDPPVDPDFWSGRELARLCADCTPQVVAPPEREEYSQARRQALRDEFLASPEGAGFAPDGDQAWVAALAIDFGADYGNGDPTRWSPVVVELFMADWVPRKVLTTDAMLQVLPSALDAWVRFAARRRGMPDWALALVREAIRDHGEEMVLNARDPEAAGPSTQFLTAAMRAGIDVEDPDALNGFLAGWNARSVLEFDASGPEPPPAVDLTAELLQMKITLTGVHKPPVWRRLLVPGDVTLDALHEIVQAAFGWWDSHLHMFQLGRQHFGPVDPELELDVADERGVSIGELLAGGEGRLRYIYDFGDDWTHEIVLEKLVEPQADMRYPVLLTAKGACPPEDCGGSWGYENLKAVLADPADPEHASIRQWLGMDDADVFDPKAVDLEDIRLALADL